MKNRIVMRLNGNRIYVFGTKDNFCVCLPGDLTEITSKLSSDEIEKVKKKLSKQS